MTLFSKCQKEWCFLRVEGASFLYFVHFPKSSVPARGSEE